MEPIAPVAMFVSATLLGLIAGVGWRIRSLVNKRWPNMRELVSSALTSGVVGMCMSLGGFSWFTWEGATMTPAQSVAIIMLSGLSGLGGDPLAVGIINLFWRTLEAIVQKRVSPL